MRRFHHWLWRSSRAFARSRRNTSGSTGAPTSLMGGERGGQLLPFAHEPRHLLLGALALGGHRAHALAVGVERRIPEPFADLGQPSLERVDLALHVLETPAQLPHVLRDLPGALGRFRTRRPNGRLRSGRGQSDRTWSRLRGDGRLERDASLGVEVVVVAAEISDERSTVDLDDPGRDAIDEVAVV